MSDEHTGSTLWHGRFEGGPDEALMAYNASLSYDQRMWRDDIAGSRAHVRGLARVGLLDERECDSVLVALDEVEREMGEGRFDYLPSDEDIHTAVERRVTELAGAAGAKLHTGRSRNDQVATDLRLWCKRELIEVARGLFDLQHVLLTRALESDGTYLPGYTHLQRAQPVLLVHPSPPVASYRLTSAASSEAREGGAQSPTKTPSVAQVAGQMCAIIAVPSRRTPCVS